MRWSQAEFLRPTYNSFKYPLAWQLGQGHPIQLSFYE